MSVSRLWLIVVTAVLAGCGTDPDPAPDPKTDVEHPDGAGDDDDDDPKPEEKPKTPTIGGDGVGSVKMSGSRTFAKEVKEFKPNDVVEIELRRGGVTRGTISTLRRRVIVISSARPGDSRDSEILTRLTPKQVTRIKLLFRPSDDVAVRIGGPLNPLETWLERFADAEVLGKDPTKLWDARFRQAVPLVVRRSFKIKTLSFKERSGGRAHFSRTTRPTQLQQLDQIKVAGITLGYPPKSRNGKETCLGEVYLYLVRRGRTVWTIHSLERLHPGDLTRASVGRFLKLETVTLTLSRPGQARPFKIRRIRASHARIYRRHLERTPDRPEVRRLRARADAAKLADAEKRVKAMYGAMGLKDPKDLDKALVIDFRLPAAHEGGIHLLPYKREIGLD